MGRASHLAHVRTSDAVFNALTVEQRLQWCINLNSNAAQYLNTDDSPRSRVVSSSSYMANHFVASPRPR